MMAQTTTIATSVPYSIYPTFIPNANMVGKDENKDITMSHK